MRGEEKRNKKPCIYGKDSKSGNVKKNTETKTEMAWGANGSNL